MVAWCALFTGLCVVHFRREKFTAGSWFEEWLGIALTLLIFELAWGFGLPATNSLDLGATRLIFQILFLLGSLALGIVMFVFFVLLLREAREVWMGLINRCIPGRSGGFNTSTYGVSIEQNPYVVGGGTSGIGLTEVSAAKDVDSAAKRGTEAETMVEKVTLDDPEHIANPDAEEHDEEEEVPERETAEVKMDLGMFDEDAEATKDTKL